MFSKSDDKNQLKWIKFYHKLKNIIGYEFTLEADLYEYGDSVLWTREEYTGDRQ